MRVTAPAFIIVTKEWPSPLQGRGAAAPASHGAARTRAAAARNVFRRPSILHTPYSIHSLLPHKLGYGACNQSRNDPCSHDEQSSDDDIHKVLFCIIKLCLVSLREKEHKTRYNKEKRDDWKGDNDDGLEYSGNKIGYRAERLIEGVRKNCVNGGGASHGNTRKKYCRNARKPKAYFSDCVHDYLPKIPPSSSFARWTESATCILPLETRSIISRNIPDVFTGSGSIHERAMRTSRFARRTFPSAGIASTSRRAEDMPRAAERFLLISGEDKRPAAMPAPAGFFAARETASAYMRAVLTVLPPSRTCGIGATLKLTFGFMLRIIGSSLANPM